MERGDCYFIYSFVIWVAWFSLHSLSALCAKSACVHWRLRSPWVLVKRHTHTHTQQPQLRSKQKQNQKVDGKSSVCHLRFKVLNATSSELRAHINLTRPFQMHKMTPFWLNLLSKGTLIDFECKLRINLYFLSFRHSIATKLASKLQVIGMRESEMPVNLCHWIHCWYDDLEILSVMKRRIKEIIVNKPQQTWTKHYFTFAIGFEPNLILKSVQCVLISVFFYSFVCSLSFQLCVIKPISWSYIFLKICVSNRNQPSNQFGIRIVQKAESEKMDWCVQCENQSRFFRSVFRLYPLSIAVYGCI